MSTQQNDANGGTPLAEPNGSVFDLRECPRCHGKTGFVYRLTIRGDQFTPWHGAEGTPSFAVMGHRSNHGAYRCADCGKIIMPNAPEQARASRRLPSVVGSPNQEGA